MPVSLLKTMFFPFGVVTTQSLLVWVKTIYPASYGMGMDSRFAISFLFNQN